MAFILNPEAFAGAEFVSSELSDLVRWVKSSRVQSGVDRIRTPGDPEAEARGFHCFYIPEHTHIPTSRRTPAPTGTEELAEEYLRSPDPYIALAAAASVTDTIRLAGPPESSGPEISRLVSRGADLLREHPAG